MPLVKVCRLDYFNTNNCLNKEINGQNLRIERKGDSLESKIVDSETSKSQNIQVLQDDGILWAFLKESRNDITKKVEKSGYGLGNAYSYQNDLAPWSGEKELLPNALTNQQATNMSNIGRLPYNDSNPDSGMQKYSQTHMTDYFRSSKVADMDF